MFVITEVEVVVFEDLKTAFTITPLFKYYDPTLPIKVETDVLGRIISVIIT